LNNEPEIMANLELETMIVIFIAIAIIIYLCKLLVHKSLELKQMEVDHKEKVEAARKDSNKRQRSVIKGQISETIAPWSLDSVNSVKELNFLGNPIDFVGFKGLDGKGEVEIKFIEVKSGNSQLTTKQRRVRDAVIAKRIEWVEVRIHEKIQVQEKVL
jgi:predicted Holliday junction resolvase-like endonuclease